MAQIGTSSHSGPMIDSKDLITTTKGWDLRIFRDEHLARRFLCALCHNVCRNAHELSCSAAHLFCAKCISELNTTSCPIDHEMNVKHQESRFVSRHIKELYVYCPRSKHVCSKLMKNARFNNNTLFCNFEGTLALLIDHTAHKCIFNVIKCPFNLIGCPGSKMYRYELTNHINSAQNKHINLALQSIQKLQKKLKREEDSNGILKEQLNALKTASDLKNNQIDKLQFENKNLSEINKKVSTQSNSLNIELGQQQKKLDSYIKAVSLLKENNTKLAKQIDNQQINNNVNQNSYNHQSQQQQENNQEISTQFNALLSLHKQNNSMMSSLQSSSQKENNNNNHSNNNNDDHISSVSDQQSISNDYNEKQPNSTDVVCAFLKDHPELVSKLKNSNQIMYANIITDDKYAAQFLKKMLQSGNDKYKNEISNIVTMLQQT